MKALTSGALALGVVLPALATPALLPPAVVHAAELPFVSEIAYAGADDTDFVEIAAAAGTDLSGYTVGTVNRGGSPQSDAHVTVLPDGSVVDESGAFEFPLPITNSVNSGTRADGSYGSSAFLVSPEGDVVDFPMIGGIAGGAGVVASAPEEIAGIEAAATAATADAGSSIALVEGTWTAGEPTPGSLPTEGTGDPLPLPGGSAEPTEPEPTEPTAPTEPVAIAGIQGEGETSPLAGRTVTTRGVVTAAYPTGGLNGYYIQTEGTGGEEPSGASDGLFVYSSDTVGEVAIGDHVEVTGTVSEYYGQTQITVATGDARVLDEPAVAPKPYEGEFPTDPAARESLEGMLVQPTGPITVTDTYPTNRYGEIGIVNGEETLPQATDVVAPGAEAQALEAENVARSYVLDDGSTGDYTRGASDVPLPYLSTEEPVRVGAPVAFTSPVVLGYGHDQWRLQPLTHLTADNADEVSPVTIENTRQERPQDVGGDLTLSSFNVLNYFTTLGEEFADCDYYTDREGNPTTTNYCEPRGAYDAENLARQQVKIVEAIEGLDADVLSLEEIENSAAFGKDRDEALTTLVDALNAKAGSEKWAFVPSPAELPTDEDVIRTAFIYQPASVAPVGESQILVDEENFDNAREPLAQEFAPLDDSGAPVVDEEFLAIVNHFKSKGSGSGPGNEDTGDGQGASNADRVGQAAALVGFADTLTAEADTEKVFLLGDFNAYTQEDPMQVLYEAGFINVGSELTDEATYLYDGRTGSLDHVLASPAAFEDLTGADVWNINSVESIGLEYSRFNSNVVDLYDESAFRSSDHDPLLVGMTVEGASDEDPGTEEPTEPEPTEPEVPGPELPGTGDGHPGKGNGKGLQKDENFPGKGKGVVKGADHPGRGHGVMRAV
ncbi:ExeM/NucH family extracellular endonuclease [Brevibacterium samyangense]|uniref:Endonuclease/exonuclease/phosphatase domain-containing protein n=1 Tax=Brevibacterium samyangense TaxID=366888 RepID=A0ABP5EIM4_9MICO